ncbi:hypothetical protein PIB30_088762 [Stylosanthes scabra]|uniref:Uncharacterized protein n=1 Tax=Stylosanthes scabra TaxID=79078 RepID=A0ABU6RUG6_9FABA|nr:hypothetical protein [Stylosanthes scabra]
MEPPLPWNHAATESGQPHIQWKIVLSAKSHPGHFEFTAGNLCFGINSIGGWKKESS